MSRRFPAAKLLAIFALGALLCCAMLAGCAHEHEWQKATCTEPKKCTECGATEGEPLGHEWQEATCTSAQICSRCREWQGESKGHAWGEWRSSVDAEAAVRTTTRECETCGVQEQKESEQLDSFLDDGKFVISTMGYAEAFEKHLRELKDGSGYELRLGDDLTEETYRIENDGSLVGMLTFSDNNGEILKTYRSDTREYGIAVLVESGNTEARNRFTVAMIRACDPSLDHDEASRVGAAMLDTGECGKNGLVYSLTKDGSYELLEAVIGEAPDTSADISEEPGISGTGAQRPSYDWKPSTSS